MGVSDLQFDTNAGKWLDGYFDQTDSDFGLTAAVASTVISRWRTLAQSTADG